MSLATAFRYEERAPGPRVAPWVLSYFRFEADREPDPDAPYTVWPDGCASIALIRVPQAPPLLVLIGPRFTALRPRVAAGMRMVGLRAWPDAAAALVGLPARTIREHVGPAPAAVAERFTPLLGQLPAHDAPEAQFAALDDRLATLLGNAPPPDGVLRAAVRAIVSAGGDLRLSAVAAAAGLSPRQLQRRFPEATGLTVREYSRVRRLRGALAQRIANTAHWSRIAAESGFVDHAHLTREFGALTGVSPSRAAEQLARTAHANVMP